MHLSQTMTTKDFFFFFFFFFLFLLRVVVDEKKDVLLTSASPFLPLECFCVQTDPNHVCQIYQNKHDRFLFSAIIYEYSNNNHNI